MKYFNKINIYFIVAVILTLPAYSGGLDVADMPKPCYVLPGASFTYKTTSSSNQVTWLSLPLLKQGFLEATGGKDQEAIAKRNTGTLEMLFLILHGVRGNVIPADATKREILAFRLVNVALDNIKETNAIPLTLKKLAILSYAGQAMLPSWALQRLMNDVVDAIEKYRKPCD